MKIHAPLSHPREAGPLVEAGAHELYCGVITPAWRARCGGSITPNAREHRTANLASFDELDQVVRQAHRGGARVSLTLNAHYAARQLEPLLAELPRALDSGVDSLIVADVGLLAHLRQVHPEVELVLGTYAACFNSQSLRFHQELGVSRVVLPRHLTLQETVALARTARAAGLAVEAFVLNMACKFIDGVCAFQHGLNEPPPGQPVRARLPDARVPRRLSALKSVALNQPLSDGCYRPFRVTPRGGASAETAARVAHFFRDRDTVDACGCCSLPELAAAKVGHVKIVGRSNPLQRKVQDVRFVRQALELTRSAAATYRDEVQRVHADIYSTRCAGACYFR